MLKRGACSTRPVTPYSMIINRTTCSNKREVRGLGCWSVRQKLSIMTIREIIIERGITETRPRSFIAAMLTDPRVDHQNKNVPAGNSRQMISITFGAYLMSRVCGKLTCLLIDCILLKTLHQTLF